MQDLGVNGIVKWILQKWVMYWIHVAQGKVKGVSYEGDSDPFSSTKLVEFLHWLSNY
jgi:hypothetical protein